MNGGSVVEDDIGQRSYQLMVCCLIWDEFIQECTLFTLCPQLLQTDFALASL